jgi:large subunit ribosomal protein L21
MGASSYAVIRDSRGTKGAGKQYIVREGERVRVERMAQPAGAKVVFDEVLLVSGANGVQAGQPTVSGARVEAVVLGEVKGDKLVVFHKRRRKFMRRRNGHRQKFTDLKVERIG